VTPDPALAQLDSLARRQPDALCIQLIEPLEPLPRLRRQRERALAAGAAPECVRAPAW